MNTHNGAYQIYQSGPESLAAEALAIIAGPVSGYTTHVLASSQGNAPIPLKWIVSGQIDQAHILKGAPAIPRIAFVRQESSPIVPADPNVPEWQVEYDNLAPGGQAVLFLTGDLVHPTIEVLPTGLGPQDLTGLLSEIIPIQAIQNTAEQTDAWLQYVVTARSDERRKAGLRSLLALDVSLPKLAPTVQYLIGSAGLGPLMRGYVFGVVTFAVINGKFEPHELGAIDFLGRHFVSETDPRVVLGYLLNLKMLLRFISEDVTSASRASLEVRIADALRFRASGGSLPPEIAEHYRQIQSAHPGLL